MGKNAMLLMILRYRLLSQMESFLNKKDYGRNYEITMPHKQTSMTKHLYSTLALLVSLSLFAASCTKTDIRSPASEESTTSSTADKAAALFLCHFS